MDIRPNRKSHTAAYWNWLSIRSAPLSAADVRCRCDHASGRCRTATADVCARARALPADGNCCLPHLSDLGPVGGTPWLRASLYSAAMIDTRRRSELAAGVALGVVALAGIGFWIGRANPGSTVHPDVLHGTVTLVGGARPVNEFVVDLDGPRALGKGYWLGPVPWTNGAGNGVTEGNTTPPCVAVGHHITFAVVHVPHGGITTDQIVWIDCGGDLGG